MIRTYLQFQLSALAALMLAWLKALVGYGSDVSEESDRVCRECMVEKMKNKGLHPLIVEVLASWLHDRFAHIVVIGASSRDMGLSNMVSREQSPVLVLWILFFKDARHAINECFYKEVVFADDLNASRIYLPGSHDSAHHNVQRELRRLSTCCQRRTLKMVRSSV